MKFHPIFKKKYNSWSELESDIEELPTAYDRGEVFEQFIFAYLNIKKNLYQIKEIYRPNDIPSKYLKKYQIEKKDSGVDGLILRDDDLSASYQVKFRSGRAKPSYDELAKFWVEGKNTELNYTIANCYSVTGLAKKNNKHLQILVDEFESLTPIFFEELFDYTNKKVFKKRSIYKPHDFQSQMIKDVTTGFKTSDRGKLIAACGTGKTLTALWIAEKMDCNTVLFLAPSLALIKQTLEAWADQSKNDFNYLCVCSDKSVSKNLDDEGDISISELNVPVTTDSDEIVKFLKSKSKTKKYIFSTYQSLKVISDALKYTNSFMFDLTIFDEAHRTAGAKETNLFSLALNNQTIGSEKRLFMTATERLIKPWLKKKAVEADRTVFSMDDTEVYGEIFHRFNFGDAIEKNVISDYQVVVAGIQESEFYKWIKENKDLSIIDETDSHLQSNFQILFSQIILAKAIKEFPINKVISFHSSVKNADLFTSGIADSIPLAKVIKEFNKGVTDENLFISHINGSMPTGDRKEILDDFKDSQYSVVSNARCLTEGVDVPVIDSVYFVDTKSSLIDIVQACGRALRKPEADTPKTAYFLIPILVPDNIDSEEILNLDAFETVFNVIQSLRDQDNRLAEWIDELNRNAVKGRVPKFSKGSWKPVKIFLPESIDLKSFEENLYLKIADVNKDATGESFKASIIYGKDGRKSSHKRIFKTLGDYGVRSYYDNLVNPTIKLFKGKKKALDIEDIKINNNNVSHTKRLGLILNSKKVYSITPLGEKFIKGEVDEKELFRRQMLRYFSAMEDGSDDRILFPYRTCLKILMNVGKLNFHEFAFAIYPLFDSSEKSVNQAISDINYLRAKFPNLLKVSLANRKETLDELNMYFKTKYTETDIWNKKTTINNQFIYFRDHLSLFSEFITIDSQEIIFDKKQEAKARHLLAFDNRLESERDINKLVQKYVQPFFSLIIFSL